MSNESPIPAQPVPAQSPAASVRAAWSLLAAFALLHLFMAALFNEFVLRRLLGEERLQGVPLDALPFSQLWFLILAVVFGAAALSVRRRPLSENPFAKPLRTEWLLAFLVVFTPLSFLEIMGRPLVDRSAKTTIFMRDRELGWKLRPNASDHWGSVPIRINAKGVRGSELPYDRNREAYRILYLGDSVTFGFGIEDDFDTYPYRVETVLEETRGIEIETINAGVGGYSPWQEHLYLEREGFRYQPDLTVVGFYLNDVTEKFDLPQFGGTRGSFQLNHSHASTLERWLAWSGTWAAIKRGVAHFRLGGNLQEGARDREAVHVAMLLSNPDHPKVQEAWEITLGNLTKIVESCRRRETDVMLIAFPDTTQIEIPELGAAPQERLAEFADAHGLPFLDLLPLMKTAVEKGELILPDHYRGSCHPTAEGVKVLAPFIADFITREFLDPSAESDKASLTSAVRGGR